MTVRRLARWCLVTTNRLCAPLDRLFRDGGHLDAEPLFIVGLPRSGTTLAYEVVVQAFKVAYFSKIYNYTFGLPNLTTRLLSHRLRRPEARYESTYGSIPGLFTPAEHHHIFRIGFGESAQLGHHVPAGAISARDARAMNQTLDSISNIAGLPYVFKDVYLTLSVAALLEHIRGSRVLVITRDPVAVAASVYRKRSEPGLAGQWWSLRPPLAETVAGTELVEQVAFQCARSRQLLEQQLATADPKRFRVFDYAEICDSPHSFVAGLQEWLGSRFSMRDAPNIPERFEHRPSVGFPGGVGDTFIHFQRRLESDRDAYLSQVEKLGAPRLPVGAGPGCGAR